MAIGGRTFGVWRFPKIVQNITIIQNATARVFQLPKQLKMFSLRTQSIATGSLPLSQNSSQNLGRFKAEWSKLTEYHKIPLIWAGRIYGQRANLMGLYSGRAYIREEKHFNLQFKLNFLFFQYKAGLRHFSHRARCEIWNMGIYVYTGELIFGMLIGLHIFFFRGEGVYEQDFTVSYLSIVHKILLKLAIISSKIKMLF